MASDAEYCMLPLLYGRHSFFRRPNFIIGWFQSHLTSQKELKDYRLLYAQGLWHLKMSSHCSSALITIWLLVTLLSLEFLFHNVNRHGSLSITEIIAPFFFFSILNHYLFVYFITKYISRVEKSIWQVWCNNQHPNSANFKILIYLLWMSSFYKIKHTNYVHYLKCPFHILFPNTLPQRNLLFLIWCLQFLCMLLCHCYISIYLRNM